MAVGPASARGWPADVSGAPDVPDRPRRPAQLRTRPPTDDAALPGDPPGHARRHGGESAVWSRAEGTLIHHAPTRAIGSLVVAMIETPFRALLVAPAGHTHARAPRLAPTRGRTVDVSAIAGGTNPKGLSTRPARAHTKDRLHEAAARSARPRRSTATSCRMDATDSACRSVDSVTRTWRLPLQVLTHRSAAAHLISKARPGSPSTPPQPPGYCLVVSNNRPS